MQQIGFVLHKLVIMARRGAGCGGAARVVYRFTVVFFKMPNENFEHSFAPLIFSVLELSADQFCGPWNPPSPRLRRDRCNPARSTGSGQACRSDQPASRYDIHCVK